MASLVADYGTSSGSDSDDNCTSDGTDNISKEEEEEEEDDEEEDDEETEKAEIDGDDRRESTSNEKLPLPTPDFNSAPTLKTSVFSNPFVEAEKAKSAILEKHVKMTPTLDDTKMINGRKICWNYRKGRCRFGHNCTFAHDSDLHRSASELEAIRAPRETVICQTRYNGQVAFNDEEHEEEEEDEEEVDQENNLTQKRKKRPGLGQTLVPGKKVLKMYKSQQMKAVGR